MICRFHEKERLTGNARFAVRIWTQGKFAIAKRNSRPRLSSGPEKKSLRLEREPMKKQHKRKLTVRVTPQTAYNLERLAAMAGAKGPGRVVDKLVREKMLALRPQQEKRGGCP